VNRAEALRRVPAVRAAYASLAHSSQGDDDV
jgi:hypothetical protein